MSGERHFVFGHYVIGVFDILGQSRKLLQPIHFPPGSSERQQIVDNLRDTAGAVLRLRELFEQQFDALAECEVAERVASQSHQAKGRTATRATEVSKIVSWGISDAYVVAVPLAAASQPSALTNVYLSLGAAAQVWLASLASGTPIRGGVELGTAVTMGENEVYGQALAAAYRIESRVAQGPRIVIGERLIRFLRDVRIHSGPPGIADRATQCFSLLREDVDNEMAIDGLGDVMANVGDPSLRRKVFARAHAYVRGQLTSHLQVGDADLVSRYEALLAYFDDRAPVWCPREDLDDG